MNPNISMKPNIANAQHEEQLMLLRDLTRRTGAIHDAQVFQMKWWPMMLFTHAKKCEAQVDVEKQQVDYIILTTDGKAPSDMEERMKALCEWTHWLLGDEYVVRVKERKKMLHRSGARITKYVNRDSDSTGSQSYGITDSRRKEST